MRDAIDERQVREVEIMADEPFEDGFRFQMEKGHYEMDTVETNLVLTVFGKDNYMNYFQGALTPDKIVYIDKKQGQKLERLAERQLFGNYSSLDPNCIIHQPQCIYKLKEMEGIDRARSLTNKVLETRDSCESLANQRNVIEHDSHEERI